MYVNIYSTEELPWLQRLNQSDRSVCDDVMNEVCVEVVESVVEDMTRDIVNSTINDIICRYSAHCVISESR